MQATLLWSLWQALLAPFSGAFTPGGFRRFVVWVTGLFFTRPRMRPSLDSSFFLQYPPPLISQAEGVTRWPG